MNRALWRKAVGDAWMHLLVSSVLLFGFSWVFVWLMSQLPVGAMATVLRWLPDFLKSMIPVPVEMLATPTGQLSVLYIHVVTQIVCVAWALGRGSDTISGEIGRGTMELIASLPVRRASVLLPPAVIASLGAAVLAGSIMAGTAVGLLFVEFREPVNPAAFFPGALNLFCLVFMLTGLTSMISAFSRDRWRTMATAGGLFVLAVIIELVRRVWQNGDWLKYCTFMSVFQPQELILIAKSRAELTWVYNGTLLALGLLSYVIAAVAFTYRDLPPPR